jgi:hypothetical protein
MVAVQGPGTRGRQPELPALTYVALTRLKVGTSFREAGELVPEAANWRNLTNYLNSGYLAVISENPAQRKTSVGKAEGMPGAFRTQPVDPYTASSKRAADSYLTSGDGPGGPPT